jgi:uncharacterized protein
MSRHDGDHDQNDRPQVPRRQFLAAGGAGAAALIAGCATTPPPQPAPLAPRPAAAAAQPVDASPPAGKARIRAFRTLGRTGFRVSEVSLGCGRISDPNLVRYAYDRGVNFFDTAEGYGSGDSERMIGAAMPHLERKKVFIATKLKIKPADTEQTLLERFGRCLGRMKTDYADALYMHSVTDVREVKHAAFHAAAKRLKAAGKLKYTGISSHGPRGKKGDPMDRVLLAAVEDGRFDLMLLVYSFMNSAPGEKVLAACKAKNVGATLMKTAPARLKLQPFNPDDPSDEHTMLLSLMTKGGLSQAEAVDKLKARIAGKREELKRNKATIDAFVARHGIKTEEKLREKSVLWTLNNPNLSTVCVSMNDFEAMDAFIPLAGAKLSAADDARLRGWRAAFGSEYCRHGCTACAAACPHDVPVSTVMRYAYYADQGSQRHAMRKYAALEGDAAPLRCLDCDAPCVGACPHGLAVPTQLLAAHAQLTLA